MLTLRAFAALAGTTYGTAKRWVHEGMPVGRTARIGKTSPTIVVDPGPAIAWLNEKRSAQRLGRKRGVARIVQRVYLAREVEASGRYKIGWSNDPERRVTELRKLDEGEHTAELLLQLEGSKPLELELHELFSPWRVEGEWFEPCEALERLATGSAPRAA